MGIIYRARNIVTDKSYVGKTTYSLGHRISNHYAKSKQVNYHFSKALRKYQKCDWEWSILCEAKDEDLDELEIFYIAKFDSYNNGYNSTLGGGGGSTVNERVEGLYCDELGEHRGTFRQLASSTGISIGAIRVFFTPKQYHRKVLCDKWVRIEDKDNFKELISMKRYCNQHSKKK